MTKRATHRVDYWRDPSAPAPTSRKTSASAFVRNASGDLLLLRRTDNGLWTIPTGAIEAGESAGQAAARECQEETGLEVAVTGLVGVFSSPDHVIAYMHNEEVLEVRQPINICVRARVVGGTVAPDPDEAADVQWVNPALLPSMQIHPALMARITHGLAEVGPYIS
ncbi:NUDIX domain-containing protein [Streptomyces bohaiensis]|uniref:NUDIX domain-containing protein n=1 Tax=Streptomyces bohaiensis TaxID=1431344 RepID=UPI003B79B0F4